MPPIAALLLMGVVISAQITEVQVVPPQAAQPRDPRAKPVVGTGAISGKVAAADTGAPVRRAQVTISGVQRPRMVYTDSEGRYSATGLPAGTYTVMVNPGTHRAGYLGAGYGTPLPPGPASVGFRPKPIELADGQQVDNINISLSRGAAIVGTVTDAAGDPIARAQVGAMLVRRGMDPSQTGGSVTTDDLGQFRVYGLAPGEYVVYADSRGDGFGFSAEVQGEVTGFATTFAPGTASVAEAMRVRVTRGGQASADIRLIESRVFSIRGSVMSSSGEVLKNANVMMSRLDAPAMMGMGGYGSGIQPDGTFMIRNVRPGQYEVIARHSPQPPGSVPGPQSMDNTEMAIVKVDVGASDIDGLMLVTQRGATVVGQIVFEDGQAEGRRVQVFTQPTDRRPFVSSPAVEVKDATFTMRNIFSRLVVRASVVAMGRPSESPSESWGLKAVLLGGRDITDEPRLFTDADSGKLQLVFTSQAPGLDGSVTDDAGKPVQEYTVLLFGDDPATWQPGSSMIRMARPMKEGKFRFRGLREGRYKAVALPSNFTINTMTPDVQLLEALSKVATSVLLNAGETRTLDLKLTPFEQ